MPTATLHGMAGARSRSPRAARPFRSAGWRSDRCVPRAVGRGGAGGQQFLTYTSPAPFQLRGGPRAALSRPDTIAAFAGELAAKRDLLCDGLRPAGLRSTGRGDLFATTDIAPVAPGLRAPSFCLALPGACGVMAIPELRSSTTRLVPRRGGRWCGRPSGRTAASSGTLGLSVIVAITIPITWVDSVARTPSAATRSGVPGRRAARRGHDPVGHLRLGISARRAYVDPDERPTTSVSLVLAGDRGSICAVTPRWPRPTSCVAGTIDGNTPVTFRTRRPASAAAPRTTATGSSSTSGRPCGPRSASGPSEGAADRRGAHERVDRVLLVRRALVGLGRRDLRARPGRHRGDRRQGVAADCCRGRGIGRRLRPAGLRSQRWDRRGSGTGSAQCSAGPYWATELGRGSARRPATLRGGAVLDVRPDGERVRIAGHATSVLSGHLCAATW